MALARYRRHAEHSNEESLPRHSTYRNHAVSGYSIGYMVKGIVRVFSFLNQVKHWVYTQHSQQIMVNTKLASSERANLSSGAYP